MINLRISKLIAIASWNKLIVKIWDIHNSNQMNPVFVVTGCWKLLP